MSKLEIGISGWSYNSWRGTFYPVGLERDRELEFASRQLPTIEINSTFYTFHKPASYLRWYETTPADFVFSVKANREMTHVKRLRNIEISIANFFSSGLLALKEKLGPILWQLPPSMEFDPEIFEDFLKKLPHDFNQAIHLVKRSSLPIERRFQIVEQNLKIRHAIEVRNMSFLNPWFIELLRTYNVAIVFADTAGKWPYMEDVTADFIYLRLHGDNELYTSGYDAQTLNFWSKRISTWLDGEEPSDRLTISEQRAPRIQRDVYVYFDNDRKVRAPLDAISLIDKMKH